MTFKDVTDSGTLSIRKTARLLGVPYETLLESTMCMILDGVFKPRSHYIQLLDRPSDQFPYLLTKEGIWELGMSLWESSSSVKEFFKEFLIPSEN